MDFKKGTSKSLPRQVNQYKTQVEFDSKNSFTTPCLEDLIRRAAPSPYPINRTKNYFEECGEIIKSYSFLTN